LFIFLFHGYREQKIAGIIYELEDVFNRTFTLDLKELANIARRVILATAP